VRNLYGQNAVETFTTITNASNTPIHFGFNIVPEYIVCILNYESTERPLDEITNELHGGAVLAIVI